MSNELRFMLIVFAVLLLIPIAPLVLIWSLNTLFPALAIEYTFWTWLATLCLLFALSGSRK